MMLAELPMSPLQFWVGVIGCAVAFVVCAALELWRNGNGRGGGQA